jgi:SRSO17 transposase
MPIVSSFGEFLASFSPLMTAPTFQNFLVIAAGWIFSTGRHSVTEVIQGAGAVGRKHYSVYHRFFSLARWSIDQVSRTLLGVLLKFVPQGEVVYLAVDDTLCRKRGVHIFGTCMHHDPLISCRKVALVNWGHNWIVVGIVLRFPFAPGVIWCLPFTFRLYISRKRPKSQRWEYVGIEHKTRPELAAEMLQKAAEWFPDRVFHVLGDSAYGGKSILKPLPKRFHLTSRLPMNAQLFGPPPARSGRGRPRKRGARLQSPAQLAADRRKPWKNLRLVIYGKKKKVQVKEIVGLWRSAGYRTIKVVVVHDPTGKVRDQAFFTTDTEATAREVLLRYSQRWAIEVAFENSKGHFGFEDPQNRIRKAVERTAPMAMVLYSLVIAWFAEHGYKKCRFPNRPWYTRKSTPAFTDILTTMRKESMREYFLSTPEWTQGSRKIIRLFAEALRIPA